jgi:hypothetical protein
MAFRSMATRMTPGRLGTRAALTTAGISSYRASLQPSIRAYSSQQQPKKGGSNTWVILGKLDTLYFI